MPLVFMIEETPSKILLLNYPSNVTIGDFL